MRDFLNSILQFIGTTTLTDEEYEATGTLVGLDYTQEHYDALAGVLASRESVSNLQEKLVAYFAAKGTSVVAASTGKSNILIGLVLE